MFNIIHRCAVTARKLSSTTTAVSLMMAMAVAVQSQSASAQQADAVVHVDGDNGSANPTGQGDSWSEAYKFLQDALERADDLIQGDPQIDTVEIWVAASTAGYTPTKNTIARFEASKTFMLADNVYIYGGFAGDETELQQRDPETNVTVLSGALTPGTDGSCFECPEEVPGCDQAACEAVVCAQPNMEYCCTFEWDLACATLACETAQCTFPADNAWHVVTAIGVGNEARINGFTITGGFAKDDSDCPSCAGGSAPGWDDIHRNGGGMLIVNASPVVARCRFEFTTRRPPAARYS